MTVLDRTPDLAALPDEFDTDPTYEPGPHLELLVALHRDPDLARRSEFDAELHVWRIPANQTLVYAYQDFCTCCGRDPIRHSDELEILTGEEKSMARFDEAVGKLSPTDDGLAQLSAMLDTHLPHRAGR